MNEIKKESLESMQAYDFINKSLKSFKTYHQIHRCGFCKKTIESDEEIDMKRCFQCNKDLEHED